MLRGDFRTWNRLHWGPFRQASLKVIGNAPLGRARSRASGCCLSRLLGRRSSGSSIQCLDGVDDVGWVRACKSIDIETIRVVDDSAALLNDRGEFEEAVRHQSEGELICKCAPKRGVQKLSSTHKEFAREPAAPAGTTPVSEVCENVPVAVKVANDLC